MGSLVTYFKLMYFGERRPVDQYKMRIGNLRDIVLTVRSITDQSPQSFFPLAQLPMKNASWAPIISAVRFAENPSALSLARELFWLSENWDQTNNINMYHYLILCPWPLAACLVDRNANDNLLQFAKLAETGQLGSLDDWMEAEERWKQKGISEQDLLYCSDASNNSWPYNNNIARIGFPFAGSSAQISERHLSGKKRLETWNILWSQYGQMGDGKAQFWLARLIRDNLITSVFSQPRTKTPITPSQLQELFAKAKSEGYRYFSLNGVDIPKSEFNEEWLNFFHWMGCELVGDNPASIRIEFSGSIRDLAKAFLNQPERTGIINTIGVLCLSNSGGTLPKSLARQIARNEKLHPLIQIALRVVQSDYEESDIEELVKLIITYTPDDKENDLYFIPFMFGQRTNLQNNIGAKIEKIMLKLFDYFKVKDESFLPSLIHLLVSRSRAKMSGLEKQKYWESLCFPQVHQSKSRK